MKVRKVLYAGEGMVLTDGSIYGRQILLAEGGSESGFYEVTEEAYEAHLKAQEVRVYDA